MSALALALIIAVLPQVCADAQLAAAPADKVGLPGATSDAIAAAKTLLKNDGTQDAYVAGLTVSRNSYVRSLMKSENLTAEQAQTFVDSFLLPEMVSRVGEMIDMDAEVLASRLSLADIAQLAAFYETPLGAKVRAAKSEIMQRMTLARQAWSNSIMVDAWTRFRHARVPSGSAP